MTFFYGVMGSGKSSMAIDYFYTYSDSIIISAGDRIPGRVTSRDGRSVASSELSHLHINRDFVIDKYKTIIVDECQFLNPEDVHLLYYMSNYGLNVVLFGLKISYLNEAFPPINLILSLADDVIELGGKSKCWCGEQAITHGRVFNDKMIKSGNPCIKDTILETFNEFYVVLCGNHWESGQWCASIPVCRS